MLHLSFLVFALVFVLSFATPAADNATFELSSFCAGVCINFEYL